LIDRVTAIDADDRMPPPSEGVALSPGEVAALRAWIDQGALAPPEPTPEDPRRHWAYQAPVRHQIPGPTNTNQLGNSIDAFLAGGYESRGLKPNPPVAKDHWLRRVFLDLIGLPPTVDDRRTFLADHSPNAERKIVDRLLADPRYGERW